MTIVFVTFESEFAPLGGLAAVMRVLPKKIACVEPGTCFTLVPFFREITKCHKQMFNQIHSTGTCLTIPFGKKKKKVEIFKHVDSQGFTTYLLDAPGFFTAPCDCCNPPSPSSPCNPYLNPSNPKQLLMDALFLSKAVPYVLVQLGYTSNLILHLQDWETAMVALTMKEMPALESATCFLTLHNSYDAPIRKDEFCKISSRTLPGSTVLRKMIPLIDSPLLTVSQHFARELTRDSLHTAVYAPHLVRFIKRKGILGINNGSFGTSSLPPAAMKAARNEDFQPLLKEKARYRQEMIHALESYRPAGAWGHLDFAGFDGPVFFFFGRDDPRQKGYDVAAAAIARMPKGKAKYIFSPIPGDEGIQGLEFLKRLAHRRPGEVKVFPFRMQQGYSELQKGSSFLVMCSFYEPFGGATEGYAAGTPVVARATGGLVQQVCPYSCRSLTLVVQHLVKPYHASLEHPSGILFREPRLPAHDTIEGWRAIVACRYWPKEDRVVQRLRIPLFRAIVRKAKQALLDAGALYSDDPMGYARMISHGARMLESFSWESSVQQYHLLYTHLSEKKSL